MTASPLARSRSIRWPWVMAPLKRATEALGSGILPGRSEERLNTLSAAGRAASRGNALSAPARAVLSPEGPWVGALARIPRSHRPSNVAVSSPMPCSALRAALRAAVTSGLSQLGRELIAPFPPSRSTATLAW
jgi:hypothetical protein